MKVIKSIKADETNRLDGPPPDDDDYSRHSGLLEEN